MLTCGHIEGNCVEALADGPSAWAEEVHQLSRGPLGFRAVWATLPGVGVRQIDGARLLLRATAAGNPITVIRKRRCTAEDVRELHALIGFEE